MPLRLVIVIISMVTTFMMLMLFRFVLVLLVLVIPRFLTIVFVILVVTLVAGRSDKRITGGRLRRAQLPVGGLNLLAEFGLTAQ